MANWSVDWMPPDKREITGYEVKRNGRRVAIFEEHADAREYVDSLLPVLGRPFELAYAMIYMLWAKKDALQNTKDHGDQSVIKVTLADIKHTYNVIDSVRLRNMRAKFGSLPEVGLYDLDENENERDREMALFFEQEDISEFILAQNILSRLMLDEYRRAPREDGRSDEGRVDTWQWNDDDEGKE